MSKERKKILIVLSGNLFIRNYIQSKAFDDLEQQYDCFYAIRKNEVDETKIDSSRLIGDYRISPSGYKVSQKIFDTLMWRYRHKSTSFEFRIMRNTPTFEGIYRGPLKTSIFRLVKWILFKPFILLKRFLLNNESFYEYYINSLINKIHHSEQLKKIIENNNFDLVVYPSTAYEPEALDLSIICREEKVKTLFIIDNWDNLSSKTILIYKPDFVAVWGEQAKQHAIEIHGFEEKQIFCIGTPRFNSYFNLRNQVIDPYFNFPYVLFLGTAVNFDEEKILKILDNFLEEKKELFKELKIIYRPHPWRQNLSMLQSNYGHNIITDPQALEGSNDRSTNYLPDLSYYPGLLKNCEFVVGGLTSMLIEALIFHKKVIGLAVDDGVYLTNMKNNWKYFKHFQGLDEIEAVDIAHEFKDIPIQFLNSWNERSKVNENSLDAQRRKILYDDNQQYSQRLSNIVNKII